MEKQKNKFETKIFFENLKKILKKILKKKMENFQSAHILTISFQK